MSRFWSDLVKNIEPYVPGEQPKDKRYIKLNTNENPYPPSPKVIEAIQREAGEGLRLYPDPNCDGLKAAVAGKYGLESRQVFVGNGSDEVLAFAFMAFFNPGREIVFPDITYSFYPVYADLFKLPYRTIPLDEDFNIPEEEFYRDNGGVVLSNPNAPTAGLLSLGAVARILEHNEDRVVIIDEAYIDFGGESAIGLINRFPNLLVVRTFSKSHALAGLRVGFALGQEELIQGLERVKNSFNSYTLDRLAMAGAVEAIRDEAYFREITEKIKATRDRTSKRLEALDFKVLDSKANFLFVSHRQVEAKVLFQQLREKGILVRYFNKPKIDNFLRVSIGTDGDMEALVKAAAEIVEACT